jgi:hypothetical protein
MVLRALRKMGDGGDIGSFPGIKKRNALFFLLKSTETKEVLV